MKRFLFILVSLFFIVDIFAADQVIDLIVGYKTVYFANKSIKAIAVNNQIPAPTLHFKEGDNVTINVHNKLDEETAIHWHGMIVPWQMDGVLGITQQGIPPGGVFNYKFTLNQSGTYWYHAHAALQEQQGLYGAFLIDPPQPSNYKYTKDYVVVLSDWSNTHPDQILANLKKEGDYYSPNFPLQPSLVKFVNNYQKASKAERKQLIDDYKMMQKMRMSIYDISDIAYDAFLLNGQPKSNPWTARVKVGDIVRLRFIGAGGSTIFHVKIPHTTMQMVHVNGNDVVPYDLSDFTIAPGETYDVLVKIQHNDPYIIYAESIDTVGAAYGALITSLNSSVNYKDVVPFPEPLPVTREMMAMMMRNMQRGYLPKSTNAKTDSSMHPISHQMHMDHSMSHQSGKGQGKTADTNKKSQYGIETNISNSAHTMQMDHNKPMNHSMPMQADKPKINTDINKKTQHPMSMDMPIEPTIIGDMISKSDSSYKTTSGTKYENLIAVVKTNDPNKSVAGVINMELFGYMERFIWFINGVPEYNAKPIILEPAKRYRMIFTNNSMMHHPMHIHGHWFILRKGHDAYDPLLHTIDVAPGATITADIDTDASGQWLFHCHMLYHMMTGMSRTFQYSTLLAITEKDSKPQNVIKQTDHHNRPIVRVDEITPIDHHLVQHPMAHSVGLWLATFLDVGADPFNNAQKINYKGLYGKDYNKLELLINDAEIKKGKIEGADIDIFYWHLLSQFWAVKGGVNYFYRPAKTPYVQPGVGIEGIMPYFIDTNIRGYYHNGSAKLDAELSRDTQITNNGFIRTGIRSIIASKTISKAEIGSGLNEMRYIVRPYYRLVPGLNIFAEYEYEKDYGKFKAIQNQEGKSTSKNTLTLGLSLLF